MRTIRFKRPRPDGTLQHVALTLDDDNCFVSEVAESERDAMVAAHPHIKDMVEHGVVFEQQGNALLIKDIPDLEREVIRFFSTGRPCWFEGCEQLRKELAETRASKKCPKCEGTLIRQFMPRVREAIVKHHASQDNNTGTGEAS